MTVHLYPIDNNAFIDGVPKIELDVDEETAEAYLAHRPPVFTTEAPEGEIVPGKLKVAELRDRLAAAGLDTSGNKAELAARLTDHLAQPINAPPSEEAETTTDPAEEAGSSVSTSEG